MFWARQTDAHPELVYFMRNRRQGQVFHYHIDLDILLLWPDLYDSNSPARFIT